MSEDKWAKVVCPNGECSTEYMIPIDFPLWVCPDCAPKPKELHARIVITDFIPETRQATVHTEL